MRLVHDGRRRCPTSSGGCLSRHRSSFEQPATLARRKRLGTGEKHHTSKRFLTRLESASAFEIALFDPAPFWGRRDFNQRAVERLLQRASRRQAMYAGARTPCGGSIVRLKCAAIRYWSAPILLTTASARPDSTAVNIERLDQLFARNRPPVSARKIPFPGRRSDNLLSLRQSGSSTPPYPTASVRRIC